MSNKINKSKKSEIVESVTGMIGNTVGVIFAGYKGLKANEMNLLRSKIRKYNCEIKVTRNSLLTRALDQIGITQAKDFVSGPTMLMFIHTGDIINILRFLFNFSKENKCLEIRGGYIYNRLLNCNELTFISNFQSKEFIVAKIIFVLHGLFQRLYFSLNYNVVKLLNILNEIKRLKR